MSWMWEEGTQEVGVSKNEGKEEGRGGITTRSIGEGERT